MRSVDFSNLLLSCQIIVKLVNKEQKLQVQLGWMHRFNMFVELQVLIYDRVE